MVAYSATDWTITLLPTQGTASGAPQARGIIMGKQRTQRARMTLKSNGGLYPSGGVGIPMPTYGATSPGNTYGMVRNVDYVSIYAYPDGNTAGIVWQHTASSPGANRLRGYWQGPTTLAGVSHLPELPTTWAVSQTNAAGLNFYVEVKGW